MWSLINNSLIKRHMQATERVPAWSAALSSLTSNELCQTSHSACFDEEVQQLLGADFVPPKDGIDMTANDVADRVATGSV